VSSSYVVTGGGRGVGRAIAARLAADGGAVVIIEMDEAALDWVPGHPAADRLSWVTGSAADERVAETAAERAEVAAPLAGWVNNAALFRDAALHTAEPAVIMDLISANLAPVVTGCAVAVRRFLAAGRARSRPGAAVSVPGRDTRPVRYITPPSTRPASPGAGRFRLRTTGSGRTGDGIRRSCRPRATARRCSPGGTRGVPQRARLHCLGRRARDAAGRPARAQRGRRHPGRVRLRRVRGPGGHGPRTGVPQQSRDQRARRPGCRRDARQPGRGGPEVPGLSRGPGCTPRATASTGPTRRTTSSATCPPGAGRCGEGRLR
jgi:hypothetical protein